MKNNVMKIVLAGLLATSLLAAPVFAQDANHTPKHKHQHVKHHHKAHPKPENK